MQLTIIVPDAAVYEDGLCYSPLFWDGTPGNVRVLQFNTNTSLGWIEFNDGTINQEITEIPFWGLNAESAWQIAYNEAHQPPTPSPITIPTQVSMRQARLALFQDGLLYQVQTAIDAMAEPAKTTTQISWDYATAINRDDDLVIQLSAQLGLTSDDLDALFTLAATL